MSDFNFDQIFRTIDDIASRRVDATAMDETICAQIVSQENLDIGSYQVSYQDNIFLVYSTDVEVVYNKGEYVYVLVPGKDYSGKKLIISKATNSSTYNDKVAMTSFYIDQGPNWIDGQWYNKIESLGICACKAEQAGSIIHPEANYWDYGFTRTKAISESNYNDLVSRYSNFLTPYQKTNPSAGSVEEGLQRDYLNNPDKRLTVDNQAEWYKDEIKSLDSYTPRQVGAAYPYMIMSADELKAADNSFLNYSRFNNFIKISADFQTLFMQDKEQGKYSLVVECLINNPDYRAPGSDESKLSNLVQFPYKIVSFELGFDSFSGDPYNYTQPTTQTAYFPITAGQLVGLYRIGLRQDGTLLPDTYQKYNDTLGIYDIDTTQGVNGYQVNYNNVLVSNIDIRFTKQVNLTDTLYYCYIETPFGDTLSKPTASSKGRADVELIAHLQYGYQDIISEDTCKIMWFREDPTVLPTTPKASDEDEHKRTWVDYSGPGWRPIEHFGEGYTVDFDKLTINIDVVPWQWRYKCVIVYNDGDQFHEAIHTIVNLSSSYSLYIEQIVSDDNKYNYLRINDNLRPIIKTSKEWYGTWYLKATKENYQLLDKEYHHGKLPINDFLAKQVLEFHVACYDPRQVEIIDTNIANPTYGDVIGLQEATMIGAIEYTIVTESGADALIEWEGDSSFQYDANGTLRSHKDEIEHILKPTLSFTAGSSTLYSFTVLSPDGTVLTNKNTLHADSWGAGHDDMKGMLRKVWIDATNVIHFHIAGTYDQEAAKDENNVFTVRLISSQVDNNGNPIYYDTKKQIVFRKDGDQGTQGSEWVVDLRPCNGNDIAIVRQPDFKEYINNSLLRPLVVDTTGTQIDTFPNKGYKIPKLYLRPFVRKNGTLVEDLDPTLGYSYKVYWDSRYSGDSTVAEKKRYRSNVRFYHANSGAIFKYPDSNGVDLAYETGGLSASSLGTMNAIDQIKNTVDGLTAYTQYPASKQDADLPETYGGLLLKYHGNTGTYVKQGVTDMDIDSDPVTGAFVGDGLNHKTAIKATIRIYKNQDLVSTLVCWYPVDVYMYNPANADNDMLLSQFATNYPKDVMYDSCGYNPNQNDVILSFTRNSTNNEILQRYDNFDLVTGEAKTWNLTPECQELVTITNYSTGESELAYRPSAYYAFKSDTIGVLRVKIGDNSYYYRNQILYLGSVLNKDVNGWDGKSIELDDENGTIFSPTVGAGYKNLYTNKFTGVIMGRDTSQKKTSTRKSGNDVRYYADEAEDAINQSEYMMGLYGYQDGKSSFGLMENGTAFFGQAEGGGRIIIDGRNGTIYGGANGELGDPTIGDALWNTLRINLVDLTHATNQTDDQISTLRQDPDAITNDTVSTTEVDGVRMGFGGKYFVYQTGGRDSGVKNDEMPDWYATIWRQAFIKPFGRMPWYLQNNAPSSYDAFVSKAAENVKKLNPGKEAAINAGGAAYNNKSAWGETYPDRLITDPDVIGDLGIPINYWDNISWSTKDDSSTCQPMTGFGPGRASTTPAIEIGQHIHGLMPAPIDPSDYYTIYKDFYIPGDRNFMVTYDGTMWAMNGVFSGNVIGSNIVGGRIVGAEIMAAPDPEDTDKTDENNQYQIVEDPECHWCELKPPIVTSQAYDTQSMVTLDNKGITARQISITGGSIDLGTFHVIGPRTGETSNGLRDYGHLIQSGESDLIGATHCYGGLGLAPADFTAFVQDRQYSDEPSNNGNLFQTYGIVALGIYLNTNSGTAFDIKCHRFMNGTENEVTNHGRKAEGADFLIGYPRTAYYSDLYGTAGSALPQGPHNLWDGEHAEQCAIFTIDTRPTDKEVMVGHFYPLSFRILKTALGYTENAENPQPLEPEEGAFLQTMDIFKGKKQFWYHQTGADVYVDGLNNFRITPWGTEMAVSYITNGFLSESQVDPPHSQLGNKFKTLYLGTMGFGMRSGGTMHGMAERAMGMNSWFCTPIILYSDANAAFRVRHRLYLETSAYGAGNYQAGMASNDDSKTYMMPGTHTGTGASILIGTDTGSATTTRSEDLAGAESIVNYTNSGPHNLIAFKYNGRGVNGGYQVTDSVHDGTCQVGHQYVESALFLQYPGRGAKKNWVEEYKGCGFWSRKYPIHIANVNANATQETGQQREIYLTDKKVFIGTDQHFYIADTNRSVPHIVDPTSKSAFHLQTVLGGGHKVEFTGHWAEPENQYGIYARFA